MTLKNLADIYDGDIKVNVFQTVTGGGTEEVVNFDIKDISAIKDSITGATLTKVTIKVSNSKALEPYIDVVI